MSSRLTARGSSGSANARRCRHDRPPGGGLKARERVLFERLMKPPQDNAPPKEVPTLREFAPRFLDGHARANRQKPSGIAAKEMILRVHLMPALGHKTARRDQERGRATSEAPLEHEGGRRRSTTS